MQPLVLLTHPLPSAPGDLEQLQLTLRNCPLEQLHELDQKERNRVQGLICLLSDRVTDKVLNALPNLKVIANYAVGLDNIEIPECTRRGIMVCHTPDVLTQASANHAFALMLNGLRRIDESARSARRGEWKGWGPELFLGPQPQNVTLGIIGAGRIGQTLGELAYNSFGMQILYFSRSVQPGFEKLTGAQRMPFEELLKKSDVVSLHCPLTEQTKALMNKESLMAMKPDALLINTSRGEVIDQQALCEVLGRGHLAYVGLDVTTPEPLPPEHELFAFDRVTVTPHIASAERQTREDMAWLCYQNVQEALDGHRPPTIFNVDVL